jgi:hypothetical protein
MAPIPSLIHRFLTNLRTAQEAGTPFRPLLLLATAALAIPYPASAAPKRDPFAGQYSITCDRKGVQCWYETSLISKAKRQYKVVFIVADRMNAAAVLCTVSGAGEVRPDGTLFIVQPGTHALYIQRGTGGDLSIEQARLGLCGGIYASGIASFIGD